MATVAPIVILWDITPIKSAKSQQKFRKKNTILLATCFMLLFCLAHSSTLKMEAICSKLVPRPSNVALPI
jgi:hypothetical protein